MLTSSGQVLRLMHEMFSDYIEAKVWQTEGIDWQYVMKNSEFTPFLTHVVNYMH